MRIYLIGYMGSGKSKVGKSLSKLLNFSFSDTDHLIEEKAGSSVTQIFQDQGEMFFRELETEMLGETFEKTKTVISTGGGLPTHDDNMKKMLDHGIVLYLEAAPGLLFQRLSVNREGRPLIEKLNDSELTNQIQKHLLERGPVYRRADLTFPAANVDVKKIHEAIILHPKFTSLNLERR